MTTLKTFTNKEDGIKVMVRSMIQAGAKVFSVLLMDTDAGEILPSMVVFADKERALNYASAVCDGRNPQQDTQQPAAFFHFGHKEQSV